MEPSELEEQHVHNVYNVISEHFSATRYKPWPVVKEFMESMPKGSVGIDLGSGNGKNAHPHPHIFTVCLDTSEGLLSICQQQGLSSLRGTVLKAPIRSLSMHYALSIACIHHLASQQRRLNAVKEACRVLQVGGKVLIFVWAWEPEMNLSVYKRHVERIEGMNEEDVLVSWQRPDGFLEKRYYHLFRNGELEALVGRVDDLKILKSGYDRDNYYLIAERTE